MCSLFLGGHWDKWRICQSAYEAGWQWRSFFCGGNWKHGGEMTNIFSHWLLHVIIFKLLFFATALVMCSLLFFIISYYSLLCSPRSQPICAPPQFLTRHLRWSRRPLRDCQWPGRARAGKNAVANACVLILNWEKRTVPRLMREKVISLCRRVLQKSIQSLCCQSGQ